MILRRRSFPINFSQIFNFWLLASRTIQTSHFDRIKYKFEAFILYLIYKNIKKNLDIICSDRDREIYFRRNNQIQYRRLQDDIWTELMSQRQNEKWLMITCQNSISLLTDFFSQRERTTTIETNRAQFFRVSVSLQDLRHRYVPWFNERYDHLNSECAGN